MHTLAILTLVASSLVNASLLPTRANSAASATSSFITESDGQLVLNGSPYPYLALDAYWLATLVDEQDVIDVLSNVSSIGVSNVVVPAYNLVNENNVPSNDSEETWLQLLHPDGSITFNEGDTGFKRLDRLVKHAKANDIHIDFTLSNNFDPRALIANQSLDDLTDTFVNGFNTTRPRNFLRNDFGGADFISATLGSTAHDFYSNQTIINVFKTIAEDIIRRYKDETAIGSWTPIKDAGCGGSLPQTGTCDTTVISSWHNDITEFIQELDPNHLVIASTTGFECDQGSADCPKLFTPTTPPPPPPQVSPAPGARRSTRTKRQVQLERKEKTKKARAVERARSASAAEGVRIRGRWISFGNARRQSSNDVVSEVTDGSTGVDSVDLGNSAVGGLTSSYLPFEKRYFKNQNNSDVENIIDLGNSWIVRQADIRDQLRITKPVYLTMGVPLSNFTNYFVLANSSIQATAEDELQGILRRQSSANIIGVSSIARTAIWTSWFTTARLNGINLIAQGLGANGISAVPRTSYSNDNDSTSSSDDSDSTTSSPNDGYNIVANDDSDSGMQSVISNAANELQIRPA